MIYCERIKNYVDQDDVCVKTCCVFFNYAEDSCTHQDWHPGLKKGRDTTNEEESNVKNSI